MNWIFASFFLVGAITLAAWQAHRAIVFAEEVGGDAAIIIADHQPVGELPYHVIRLWVKGDGRWQLFHRQETTIK